MSQTHVEVDFEALNAEITKTDGVYWQGVRKPAWSTFDLIAAGVCRIPSDVIDEHKTWDDDQCEIGLDCAYCGLVNR